MNHIHTKKGTYTYEEGVIKVTNQLYGFQSHSGERMIYTPSSGFRLVDSDGQITPIDYLGDYTEDKMFQLSMLFNADLLRDAQHEMMKIHRTSLSK
ncbi:TPA: hypothetical protein QCJ52_004613 [Enterobacter ludwigii]|uniref:hypothetical protein n=1 Tax=Enterobacter ludwigii TaxID=299767 RepID=UPI002FD43638|nr:hypothetical protein [Enterobacter kobei]HDR2686612.1 hypothetical protein [Enterobacter ludwigii]